MKIYPHLQSGGYIYGSYLRCPIWIDRRDHLSGRLSQIVVGYGGDKLQIGWMACGLVEESVEALIEGVMESGAAEELHMSLGLRFL